MEAGLSLRKQSRLRNKDMNMVMWFGTWNVRTGLQAGNTNMIVEEAEEYKMDIVPLQEIRWKGRDSIRKLDSPNNKKQNWKP